MNFKEKLIKKQKSKKYSNLSNVDTKNGQKSVTNNLNNKHQTKKPEISSKRPKEKMLLSRLTEIYDTCEEITATELVEIINNLPISIKTKNITNMLMNIVAKRSALDCIQFGVPRIPTLMRIVPAIDMLDANLPSLVEKEYDQVKLNYIEQGHQYHEYGEKEKQCIKMLLLENIAKQSAKNFASTGDFNLPKSNTLRSLNSDDLMHFVNTLETFYTEKFSVNDKKKLLKELKGEVTPELQDINRMLEKMSPKDKNIAIDDIFNLLKSRINKKTNDEEIKLDKTLAEITTKIQQLPPNKQLSTAETILNVLEQQQESINMLANCKKTGTDR